MALQLSPLQYHRKTADWLERSEPEVWQWFENEAQDEAEAKAVRLDLLKQTYQLDEAGHGALLKTARDVAEQLGISAPLSIYQATSGGESANAALFFQPDAVHLVFFGRLLEILDPEERAAVLAHELGHYLFWTLENGRFRVVHRFLDALCRHPEVTDAYLESARLFRLFTEVYADRVALAATRSLDLSVRALVKVRTGLQTVSASAYLDQARRILAEDSGEDALADVSHPELYRRVEALRLYAENAESLAVLEDGGSELAGNWPSSETPDNEETIQRLVEGALPFERWDLLHQLRGVAATEQLVKKILAPEWMRTEATLGHAAQFVEQWAEPGDSPSATVPAPAEAWPNDSGTRRYVAYLLLDFAAVDPDLGEKALIHLLTLAESHGCRIEFEDLLRTELKWLKRDLMRLGKEVGKEAQ
jgi:hypothetical protein